VTPRFVSQSRINWRHVPSVLHVRLSYLLPGMFVLCPKRWKPLLPVGLATGYGCTAGTKWIIHPTVSISRPVISLHLFESFKKGLAGEQFASEPDLKQAVSWTERNAISATPGYNRRCHVGTNAWMPMVNILRSDVYHLQHTCDVYVEGRIIIHGMSV
jgi:hypothetical protein